MPDHANWSPTRLRTEAIAAERSSRPADAIDLLEAALRREPDDWKSLRLLAGLLVRLDRRREANEHYRHLAALYEKDQLYARAIAAWKIVLAGEPDSVSVQVKLGELFALGGHRADAREHYGKALAACRASRRTREAALIEARIANLDEASDPGKSKPRDSPAKLDEGAAPAVDDPDFVEERLGQARLFRRYGLIERALGQLTDVIDQFPGHVGARSELRDLLVEAGRHEEAAALAKPGGEHHDPIGDLEGFEAPDGPEALEVSSSPEEEGVPALDFELKPLGPEDHLPVDLDDEWTSAGREIRSVAGAPVPRDDYETRYDLGIAYREMGLLDEAIAELQLASRGSSRLIESTSLLAACLLDKGLPKLAIQWLERGLESPGLLPQQVLSLRYDLARAHEARGESELALSIYVELYGEDAGFRDVAEKVQRLRQRSEVQSNPEPALR